MPRWFSTRLVLRSPNQNSTVSTSKRKARQQQHAVEILKSVDIDERKAFFFSHHLQDVDAEEALDFNNKTGSKALPFSSGKRYTVSLFSPLLTRDILVGQRIKRLLVFSADSLAYAGRLRSSLKICWQTKELARLKIILKHFLFRFQTVVLPNLDMAYIRAQRTWRILWNVCEFSFRCQKEIITIKKEKIKRKHNDTDKVGREKNDKVTACRSPVQRKRWSELL